MIILEIQNKNTTFSNKKLKMNSKQLESLTSSTCKQVGFVAQFILKELKKVNPNDIETKSLNSLVSYVDKNAEMQLVEKLRKLLPEATFLTEEETIENNEGEYRWIIDPLDGTTNFLHQLPFFSISVALEFQGEIILGVVYEVNRNECFSAWKNGGAYLNDSKIEVSKRTDLGDALIATGFPYYDYRGVEPYFEVLEFFIKNTRGVRRFGSAALDLAYVACGRFDSYYEYSLNAWDVAAGVILVKEAGGKLSDFQGGENFLFGREMIAASPHVFDKTLEVVKTAFSKNR